MALESNKEILFTRQRHDAKRAGLHWDIRLVHGDKAYSYATRKDLPDPGKAIMVYEQPVHTSHYALQERVEIPDGQYGAGITTLDFVKKALVGPHSTADKFVLHIKNGDRFLFKRMSEKYGRGNPWLIKNLGSENNDMTNRYLNKIAEIVHRGHTFSGYNEPIDAPADDKHKKIVLAKDGDQVKLIRFGARGYGSNYSEKARNSYLARSAKIKGANDKLSANYWAREHLWRPNSQVYEKPKK